MRIITKETRPAQTSCIARVSHQRPPRKQTHRREPALIESPCYVDRAPARCTTADSQGQSKSSTVLVEIDPLIGPPTPAMRLSCVSSSTAVLPLRRAGIRGRTAVDDDTQERRMA